MGVSSSLVTIDGVVPSAPLPNPDAPPETQFSSPSVAAAYANALAREQQAEGDAHYRFRPQINLFMQYNRYATFTDSFKQLQQLKCVGNYCTNTIGADEAAIGVQITLPLYDRYRQAKARESAADASHALHEAENSKLITLDAQAKLRHSIPEIQARAEVANLKQQLAQQQLEVLHVQLVSGNGNTNSPQMTPKDEQNYRIDERDKYLSVLEAAYQLRQAEVQLLRLTGGLEAWLKTIATQSATAPPEAPAPH